MQLRLALAPLALAVVALPVGCGGGSGRLSKEEFAKQADSICRDFQAKIGKLGSPRNFEELAKVSDEALPLLEDGVGRIRGLKPPKDEQSTVDQWLVTGDKSIQALEDVKRAAEQKSIEAIRRIAAEARQNDKKGNALARKLGMTECAKSSGS